MNRIAKILLGLLTLSLLASCGGGARVEGRLSDANAGKVFAKILDGADFRTVDSAKVAASGKYTVSVPVAEGQPEFAYLYYGERRVASLILRKGDKVSVETDTLGTLIALQGSPESTLLQEADSIYTAFSVRSKGLEGPAFTREYIDLYRRSVAFVISHSRSLAVIPVLLRKVSADLPVFAQQTDGLIFSNIADSLALSYPDSRYVRLLRKEGERRQNALSLSNRLALASESAFPEIELPDTRAQQVKLSSVEAPLVMLYFWSTSNEEKMFNLDALQPLYDEFHGKGLEIFAVALDPDKAEWAATVKRQGLGWINVCDTRGASSPYIGLYGITQLPTCYFIRGGEIDPSANVTDAASLRTYIVLALK